VKRYSLKHLSDESLLRGLIALVAQDRITTAELLAHIAEVDERKLYLPGGHASMFAYCVAEFRLSEDAAAKRIQAARVARRFPAIFEAVARGRLHLTAVGLLAPYLIEETAAGLLAAAEHKTKIEIEQLLAERFPKSEMLAWEAEGSPCQHAPAHVDGVQVVANSASDARQFASGRMEDHPRVTQLSTQSVALQVTLERGTHEKLRYAGELLGHQVPAGDIATVLGRTFGPEFMRHKRISAAEMRAAAQIARARQAARTPRPEEDPDHSVVPWLRALGFSAAEAGRAAERCKQMMGASLEEKVRAALTTFRVRGTRVESGGERSAGTSAVPTASAVSC